MSYTNNIYKMRLILITGFFLILFSTSVFSASLFCNNTNLSYNNNDITCFYNPDSKQYLNPKISGITLEEFSTKHNSIYPGTSWTFKMKADIDSSLEGQKKVTIEQDNFKQEFLFHISKDDILETSYNIEYEDTKGIIVLKLKNNSKNTLVADVEIAFPDEYSTNKDKQELVLTGKSQISLKIPFEYSNADKEYGQIKIKYKVDNKPKTIKEVITFDPYKIPYQDGKLTAYFLLSNNKVMLGVDILLLIEHMELSVMHFQPQLEYR